MSKLKPPAQSIHSEVEITLGLLNAVQKDEALTQRRAAQELGIALGLANAYMKRCVHKGFIKVQQVPKNRYAYYLTPRGFAEKTRLTAEYLSQSFNFFRLARSECEALFSQAAQNGWREIALLGMSDLAEIAILCSRGFPVTLSGFADGAEVGGGGFAGLPVILHLADIDAVLVTDLAHPQAAFVRAVAILPAERVLTPSFLQISREPGAREKTA